MKTKKRYNSPEEIITEIDNCNSTIKGNIFRIDRLERQVVECSRVMEVTRECVTPDQRDQFHVHMQMWTNGKAEIERLEAQMKSAKGRLGSLRQKLAEIQTGTFAFVEDCSIPKA